MEDIRKRKGKVKGEKSERVMNCGLCGRDCGLRNKRRILEGRRMGGWVSLVVGIKGGMYCMEHWVLYMNNESWNTIVW